jgi:hypothetical protein
LETLSARSLPDEVNICLWSRFCDNWVGFGALTDELSQNIRQ